MARQVLVGLVHAWDDLAQFVKLRTHVVSVFARQPAIFVEMRRNA